MQFDGLSRHGENVGIGEGAADLIASSPSGGSSMPRSAGFATALALVVVLGMLLFRSSRTLADPPAESKPPAKSPEPTSPEADKPAGKAPALAFTMKDIDGKPVNLADYVGRVVVLVNTASKCGYTKQYAPMQKLYEKYKDQGLVVIAVPANNFGKQEPGTNAEIKEFCSSKFSVNFPILAKVSVKGDDICPLYKYLTAKDKGHDFGGEIPWNFTKFLVNRKGEVIGRYGPKVDPMADEKFIAEVEKALKEPGGTKPTPPAKEPAGNTPG